ncbi:MAG: L-2-amino-thiazoline-4-carboxylic acid hydrolase [Candidatus Kariarchaeaceae archaeon]|jgi:hypothetical protein
MFEPEYRASFRVLRREIGLFPTLKITLSSLLKSKKIQFRDNEFDIIANKKAILKNHFRLLASLYSEMIQHYTEEKTLEVMHKILVQCGPIFMRGFKPLGPNEELINFIPIYKEFESQNLIFDVVKESPTRFEIVVKRCLIYEAFKELGLEKITHLMCDIAFLFFKNYHPQLLYYKDQMIAKGNESCHEVFIWQN